MIFIVSAAWIVGVAVSFIYGNRILPLTILVLGTGILAAIFSGFGGWPGVAVLSILAVIIWISNKIEMT
jgi:hypothetical protein